MGARKILGGIGKVAKFAAPALALTGVGAPIAALVGAGGAALERATKEGANVGNVLGSAAKGGVYGGLGAAGISRAAGGATGLAGVRALAGNAGNLLMGRPTAEARDPSTGELLQAAGRTPGVVGGITDWIKRNPGLAATLGLGAASAITGARQDAQNDDLRRQALTLASQGQDERAALAAASRKALLGGMPARRSLADLYADPGNAYSRRVA